MEIATIPTVMMAVRRIRLPGLQLPMVDAVSMRGQDTGRGVVVAEDKE